MVNRRIARKIPAWPLPADVSPAILFDCQSPARGTTLHLLPPLQPSDVHIWTFDLGGEDRLGSLLPLLSAEERAAGPANQSSDRWIRRALGRAITRRILGGYLGRPVRETFIESPNGKPALPDDEIRFNLSHTGGLGMLAVSVGLDVGIDLEAVNPMVDTQAIAARFFSAREVAQLQSLPPSLAVDGFFHVWTQKEAYLKGRGDGITAGLEYFDTEADPRRPAALLADRRDPTAATAWHLQTLVAPQGLRATVATHGPASIHQIETD